MTSLYVRQIFARGRHAPSPFVFLELKSHRQHVRIRPQKLHDHYLLALENLFKRPGLTSPTESDDKARMRLNLQLFDKPPKTDGRPRLPGPWSVEQQFGTLVP